MDHLAQLEAAAESEQIEEAAVEAEAADPDLSGLGTAVEASRRSSP